MHTTGSPSHLCKIAAQAVEVRLGVERAVARLAAAKHPRADAIQPPAGHRVRVRVRIMAGKFVTGKLRACLGLTAGPVHFTGQRPCPATPTAAPQRREQQRPGVAHSRCLLDEARWQRHGRIREHQPHAAAGRVVLAQQVLGADVLHSARGQAIHSLHASTMGGQCGSSCGVRGTSAGTHSSKEQSHVNFF